MTIGFYGVVLDHNGDYKSVKFGRTEEDVIRNVKLDLLDSHMAVSPGTKDTFPLPNGHVQFPVGDEKWTIEVGSIDFER